ncbi:MAG: hypothetical protein MJZ11_13625 [Lachnospiraceae bacterium]|nr:hypothetical protein [Lachnospiraceae bacterium]
MKRFFVSFDVFDTCLIRRCGRPEKIWDLMANRLFEKDDARGRMSFVGNRSIVESRLLQRGLKCPTLAEIYEELNVAQWGFDKESLMLLEMDVEKEELSPNPEMLSLVNEYRNKGYTVAFVSDMYLPVAFLKDVLISHGFCMDSEKVFVSSECRADKFSGSLFDFVFTQTKTKACQWIHYGDNRRCDYYVPKSKGVKAHLVSNSAFSEEEKRWLDDAKFYFHKHEIELWAGLSRLTRLQGTRSESADMAIDFIGSIYIPFVYWTMEESQKRGIKKLFFLGRDGHIFYEIAKQINSKYPEIDIAYLKISRKAIYSGMFVEGSADEFSATLGNSCDQKITNLLNQVGFDYKDLSEIIRQKYPDDYRLFEKNKDSFFKDLLENDAAKFVENSKKHRTLLLDYFKQENVLNGEKGAFVDLGWYGSCRCNLNYILGKEGYDSIPTFYWGVYDKLLYGKPDDELYIFQKQFGLNGSEHSFLNEFMEHYASLNSDGSAIGYLRKDKMEPLENAPNLNSSAWMKINEDSVASLCHNALLVPFSAWNEIFLCCGLKQLDCLYKSPSKKEIKFFSKLHVENFGKETSFVQRLSLKNILALLVWGRPAESTWTSASINKTFGFLSPIFVKVYQSVSQSSLAMRLRLWWDGRK